MTSWLTEKIPDRLRSRNAVARRPDTFDATSELAQRAGVAFALFVMLTPFPATVDFERWEKAQQTRARENQWYPTRPRSVSLLRACLGSYSFPSCTGRCMPVLASDRQRATESSTFLGTLTWEAYPVPVSGETFTESGKPPRSKPLTEAVAHAGNCTGRTAKPPCVSLTD